MLCCSIQIKLFHFPSESLLGLGIFPAAPRRQENYNGNRYINSSVSLKDLDGLGVRATRAERAQTADKSKSRLTVNLQVNIKCSG